MRENMEKFYPAESTSDEREIITPASRPKLVTEPYPAAGNPGKKCGGALGIRAGYSCHCYT